MSQSQLPVLAAACVLSIAAGAMAGMFASERSEAKVAEPQASSGGGQAAYQELLQRQSELERTIADLRTRLDMAPVADTRSDVSDADIAAAVARYMSENRAAAPAIAPAQENDAVAAARQRERTIADALSRLTDPSVGDGEKMRIWKELFESGLGDQVLAEFEARAERDPNDPDARVDLAEAYLQKLFTVTSGPEMGVWGAKADKAYDAALALDPNHWEARFGKAVALSNWPPFLGKQPEAIKNFEQLIEQQSTAPKSPKFASTHLILGNMYLQSGQKEKALTTWQNGLALYPENEALRKQIELSGG